MPAVRVAWGQGVGCVIHGRSLPACQGANLSAKAIISQESCCREQQEPTWLIEKISLIYFFFPLSARTSLFKIIFQPGLASEIGLQLLARPWWEMLPASGYCRLPQQESSRQQTTLPALQSVLLAESEGQMTAPKI